MVEGTIKTIKQGTGKGTGFGFITPDGGGQDVFFHFSGCEGEQTGFNELNVNDRVRFDMADGREKDKPRAVHVAYSGD